MITLTQIYNNVFCSLLLNLKVWFKEYQELIAPKHIADTPIHWAYPFRVLVFTQYSARKRHFFSKPVDYIIICISYLYSGVVCTWSRYMAVSVKETSNIANLVNRKARKINFNFFNPIKCVGTRVGAVSIFSFMDTVRVDKEFSLATLADFFNFRFFSYSISEFVGNTTRALSRAKSLLPSGKGFLAFFACFHRFRLYKLTTECKGKNYEN